jgi:hypothetical protein
MSRATLTEVLENASGILVLGNVPALVGRVHSVEQDHVVFVGRSSGERYTRGDRDSLTHTYVVPLVTILYFQYDDNND